MTLRSEFAKAPGNDRRFGELSKRWGWLLALGLLLIVLGLIGLSMEAALTIVSILYYGVLLLIAGGAQIAQAASCRGWQSILMHVLIALLYLGAGIICIVDPLAASAALTLLIAIALIAIGVARIVIALSARGGSNWLLLLLGGGLAVLLGLVIAAHWPFSGLWVIGLFVAIELIVQGWTCVMIALAARAYQKSA